MIAIDHVIVPVPNLDEGAEQLLERLGLSSVNGGSHAGHGTGNRIVPLGTNYLELMAVVDPAEAVGSPLGRWVTENATADLIPAALCLRTDDISSIGTILEEEPEAMSRLKPDGTVLSWHLTGLSGLFGPDSLPFFIEWHCQPDDHPAATPIKHRTETTGIAAATIGTPGVLAPILSKVEGVTVGGGIGVRDVVIAMSDGPIILG